MTAALVCAAVWIYAAIYHKLKDQSLSCFIDCVVVGTYLLSLINGEPISNICIWLSGFEFIIISLSMAFS